MILKNRQNHSRFFAGLAMSSTSLARLGLLVVALLGVVVQPLPASTREGELGTEEALRLGEEFGVIVGEVDEELRAYLGLEKAEGVVVFEVLGGKPADLAGIKAKSIIKEINSVEIKTLKDFGRALKAALPIQNFSLVTYEPPDPSDQGVTGGIQFHFVRIEQS